MIANTHGQWARKGRDLSDTSIDFVGHTDVHFGIAPTYTDLTALFVSGKRAVAAEVGDDEGVFEVAVVSDGDSWVEWGEGIESQDDEPRNYDGKWYGRPGLHVIVRFGPMPDVEATYFPQPWPAYNPTGLQKSERYVAQERGRRLFALGILAVEECFADLLGNGFRLCDYGVVTDAEDWAENPSWDTPKAAHLYGMYA